MKKGLIFVLMFCLLAPGYVFAATCPIKPETNVVIYGQTGIGGVGDLSKSWMTHFFDWWKTQDSGINYMYLTASNLKSDCNLVNYPNVRVYVQPGGDAYYQQKTLGSSGKTNLNNYINSKRGYVGVCAGFYYTAGDYYWQSKYYNWANLLGKYPTVEGSITDIANYGSNPGYALTMLSNGEQMIYYGGPTRGWRQTPSDFLGQALLTYTSIPGNLPASIKYDNMLLMSVHAEAYENEGISGLTSEQRLKNYIWFANAINSVAGTNFFVPLPPSPSICGNGICEAGENNQNCAVDCPPSSDIFYDNFESGLVNWITSAVSGGNQWTASLINPYQGSYSAYSKPMSTINPASVLETSVSTVGYSNLKIGYFRKLVGLDAADEFQAKWFDGTNWNILEQTGSNSADDANYLYKEFVLPSSAGNNPGFKIRFECTAGAVSEYCLVDNVRLFSF